MARQVLRQLREKPLCLIDGVPNDAPTKEILCRQEALATSKDPELNAATRHDEALDLLLLTDSHSSRIKSLPATKKLSVLRVAFVNVGGMTSAS